MLLVVSVPVITVTVYGVKVARLLTGFVRHLAVKGRVDATGALAPTESLWSALAALDARLRIAKGYRIAPMVDEGIAHIRARVRKGVCPD
jgi:hypothetical protein